MGSEAVPRQRGESVASGPAAWTLAVVAAGAVLIGISLVVLAFGGEEVSDPAVLAALACWVTLPYILAGLVAWQRRPDSQLGVLMIAAGFVTYANFFVWSTNDVLHTLGLAAQFLPPVVFIHVFLAFPSGHLADRVDRVVVGAAYAAAALTVPSLVLGVDAPRNVLALVRAPDAALAIQNLQLLLLAGLALAGIAVLARRRRRDGRPLRAAVGWLVDAFALGLLMIAVLLLAGLFTWTAIVEPARLTTFAVVGAAPVVFLAGLLQARLGRAGVAELLVDLGVNPGPAELQNAIMRALRDPSVTLAYWLPEFASFADVDGRQTAIEAGPGRSATPITRDGARVAMILHDAWLDEEPQLLASVAAAAGLAIENAQLQVDLRARLADVRASRARIVSAGDAERKRLERDLHDGAQQRLVALSLALRRARSGLTESDENLAPSLDDASMLVKEALEELRTLARGIHPAVLTELGLAGALGALAGRSPVPVTIEALPPDRLPQPVEAAAYFVVSEALANVAKHAPGAVARVRATVEAGRLLVEVMDDGPGGAAAAPGSGLQGLDDRVAAVGGHLEIANPPGGGTSIRASIPVDPEAPPAS